MRVLIIVTLLSWPLAAQTGTVQPGTPATSGYAPATAGDRAGWWVNQSFGWANWAGGAVTTGFWTWQKTPPEWGSGFEGYAKRYGTRQAEVTMANGVEAVLGAAWKEDPRFHRSGGKGVWRRMKWAVSSSFLAHGPSGQRRPAVARGIGFLGARAVTGTWRPDSEQDWQDYSAWALVNGFGARAASNIFLEFAPDLLGKNPPEEVNPAHWYLQYQPIKKYPPFADYIPGIV